MADVAARIVKQLEYYFGDRNLPQDRFMLREVTLDNGWISLDTMLNFKRFVQLVNELMSYLVRYHAVVISFVEILRQTVISKSVNLTLFGHRR